MCVSDLVLEWADLDDWESEIARVAIPMPADEAEWVLGEWTLRDAALGERDGEGESSFQPGSIVGSCPAH
jgi:hypothetical protein